MEDEGVLEALGRHLKSSDQGLPEGDLRARSILAKTQWKRDGSLRVRMFQAEGEANANLSRHSQGPGQSS